MMSNLDSLLDKYRVLSPVVIEVLNNQHGSFKYIKMESSAGCHVMYIDDEYDDFSEDNQLLNFYLVLRSLELYEESIDFLHWCQLFSLPSNNEELRQAYMETESVKRDLLGVLDDLDPCIPLFDYELGAGETESLRTFRVNL